MMEPRTVERFGREVRAIARHADDPEGFAQAVELLNRLQAEVTEAANRLNAEGYSWTDLSRPLGVSRQAARQRFAK